MEDATDFNMPEADRQRQAVASIRGYIYQIYSSALAWAALAEDEVLLLEVADDFAVVTTDALSLTQIKDAPAGSATTLRTPGVIATINSFWRMRVGNRAKQVKAAYLTTSRFGRERPSPLPSGRNGLDEWRAAAREGYPLGGLKALLAELPLEADLLDWLRNQTDETIRLELVRAIRWEGGQPDLNGLDALFIEQMILAADRQGLLPSDARRVREAMLFAVMQRVVDPQSRCLSRAQFLDTFEAATSVSMPLSAVRRAMAGAGGAAASSDRLANILVDAASVPSATLYVDRAGLTRDVLERLQSGDVIWLHGISGSGKTTSAINAVRGSNRAWHLVELRGLTPEGVADRLRLVRSAPRMREFGGLILDDFPTSAIADVRLQLSLLSAAVRQADGGLVLTAYRAPPPSLSSAFADLIHAQSVPGLDEEEVGQVIALAGGDVDRWKRVIWLSCGGHPQLVAARVTGLKSRNWPAGEDLHGLLPDLRALDLDSERDAVRERLLDELNDKTRALLFRLSIPLSGFDRALALSVGAADPALVQPGEALDFLVGPWIETTRPGRFSVSPLVADAGAKTLTSPEQHAVHWAICEDISKRRPIPGEYINQLLVSGFVTSHAEALKIVAISVIMTRDKDREAVLEHLEPLIFFQTQSPLVDGDPETSALLRLAQLKVAIARAPAQTTRRVFVRALVEAETSQRAAAHRQAAIFAMLNADVCALQPAEWFALIREMEGMDLPIPLEKRRALRQRTAYTGSEQPAEFMFTWRAIHIASIAELEALFEVLDDADADVRDRYLSTLSEGQAGSRSVIQFPWVREAEMEGFDPAAAASRYAGLQSTAVLWGRTELAIQCVAARSTLLSEYAGQHEDALAALSEAEHLWPNEPRLQRERIKIFFRLGRHQEVVEETQRYLSRDVADPIDRAHALRELAVSTANLGDLKEAARLFGEAATNAAVVPTMRDMQAGLLGDQAHALFETGLREAALYTLIEAAHVADELDRDAHRGGFVLRMIAGVAAWMVNQLAGGDMDATAARVGACSGAASDLEWPNPVPQKEAIWYQAAAIERQLGLDGGVRQLVEVRVRGRRISAFEFSFGFDRLIDASYSTSQETLCEALINVGRILTYIDRGGMASVGTAIHNVTEVMPWEDLPVDLSDGRVRSPVDDALISFVVGNVLQDPDYGVTSLANRLEQAKGLESLADPVRSWSRPLEPEMDVLPAGLAAAAVLLGPPTGDASSLMLATFRLWEWLERSVAARRYEAALATRIASQWLHLTDNAQFALRTPALTAPAIRQAARKTLDRRSIAQLLLVADDAVASRMGNGVRDLLKAKVG